jgi:phage shock protein PspC (stress-responsive transcriptional regulator)
MTHDTNPERRGPRTLRRTQDGRLLAGVCSGFGAYAGIDANIIRLVLVLLTAFGGTGALVYAAGWLLLPEEGEDRSILQRMLKQG